MLQTFLTRQFNLRYPIIGAPLANVGESTLARAISKAGGLGFIGIGSDASVAFIETQADLARGDDHAPFGLGLMLWAIERRPELLDAAVAARPSLLSLSFGSPSPFIDRAHRAGILVATQINTVAAALHAEECGVDTLVAQGSEAGGHTGHVGTLPLLQAVLDAVRIPVVAAGGIASPRGLAAVIAAGAEGAWMGTAFLACPECVNNEQARKRVVEAREADTVLTHVFDRVQGYEWPSQFPGRALRNAFAEQWHGHEGQLSDTGRVAEAYREARAGSDYDVAVIYAGQAVALVNQERSAAQVIQDVGDGAETLLRHRWRDVLQADGREEEGFADHTSSSPRH